MRFGFLEGVENENINFQLRDTELPIIKRGKKSAEFMVQIFCNAKHKTNDDLCLDYNVFLSYVKGRLDHCPYQTKKPACGV